VRHRRMDASPAQVRSSHKIVPAGSLGYRDIEKDSGVIVGTRWAGFGILCRPGPGYRAWCHSFGVFCHSAGRRLDQIARPAVIGQRLPWSRSGFCRAENSSDSRPRQGRQSSESRDNSSGRLDRISGSSRVSSSRSRSRRWPHKHRQTSRSAASQDLSPRGDPTHLPGRIRP
jgi:hypothetical protein